MPILPRENCSTGKLLLLACNLLSCDLPQGVGQKHCEIACVTLWYNVEIQLCLQYWKIWHSIYSKERALFLHLTLSLKRIAFNSHSELIYLLSSLFCRCWDWGKAAIMASFKTMFVWLCVQVRFPWLHLAATCTALPYNHHFNNSIKGLLSEMEYMSLKPGSN